MKRMRHFAFGFAYRVKILQTFRYETFCGNFSDRSNCAPLMMVCVCAVYARSADVDGKRRKCRDAHNIAFLLLFTLPMLMHSSSILR